MPSAAAPSISLVVARKGDTQLLRAGIGLAAVVRSLLLEIAPTTLNEFTSEKQRRAALARVSESYGLNPEDVEREILTREGKIEEPNEDGLLALWHPEVAITLNNLAELYRALRRYAEAETLYKRSLLILEKSLGADHPNAATVLENYASLLRKVGRNAEAEEAESRVRTMREKARRNR